MYSVMNSPVYEISPPELGSRGAVCVHVSGGHPPPPPSPHSSHPHSLPVSCCTKQSIYIPIGTTLARLETHLCMAERISCCKLVKSGDWGEVRRE